MVTSCMRKGELLERNCIKWTVALMVSVLLLALAPNASAGTLLEWNMNEGAGSTSGDSSGNGRDGIWNADMIANGSWVAGRTGAVGDFAAKFTQPVGPVPRIEWIDAGNPLPLTQNGNFEVEMWLNADGFAADEYLLVLGQGAGTTVAIRVNPSLTANASSITRLDMTTYDNGLADTYAENSLDLTGNSLNAGQWQHIRLAYTETSPFVDSATPGSSTVDFYVDGNLADSVALSYALADVTDQVRLGNLNGGIWYRTFRGAIDDFKISSIPEPASWALGLIALTASATFGRRKKA